MEEQHCYALRMKGSGDLFVKTLPHDYEDSNCVKGWDNAHKGLTYATEEEAQDLLDSLHHDESGSLMVEEVKAR